MSFTSVIDCRLSLAALAVVVGCAGCLMGEVAGIPCDADDACPSDYFCNLPRSECRELTDAIGPPLLKVLLIADPSGSPVVSPAIPSEVTSSIALLPENVGGVSAERVSLSFAELNCITFDIDESTLPAVIAVEASGSIRVALTPGAGCEGLAIIDWFLVYSGRETRGTFDLNVRRP